MVMSSNGSLLDERRSLGAARGGLQQILVNVGEEGDDYEEIYQLPFERTLENVVRFNEMSAGVRGGRRARRPPWRPGDTSTACAGTGPTTGSSRPSATGS